MDGNGIYRYWSIYPSSGKQVFSNASAKKIRGVRRATEGVAVLAETQRCAWRQVLFSKETGDSIRSNRTLRWLKTRGRRVWTQTSRFKREASVLAENHKIDRNMWFKSQESGAPNHQTLAARAFFGAESSYQNMWIMWIFAGVRMSFSNFFHQKKTATFWAIPGDSHDSHDSHCTGLSDWIGMPSGIDLLGSSWDNHG